MAKKKLFAGKKTKLAKLPLTQALAGQAESGLAKRSPLSPLPSGLSRPPHTWDAVIAGSEDPLATVLLSLVRGLADLKSRLQSGLEPAVFHPETYLPSRVPRRPQIVQALHQARQSLLDLQGLLSHP